MNQHSEDPESVEEIDAAERERIANQPLLNPGFSGGCLPPPPTTVSVNSVITPQQSVTQTTAWAKGNLC